MGKLRQVFSVILTRLWGARPGRRLGDWIAQEQVWLAELIGAIQTMLRAGWSHFLSAAGTLGRSLARRLRRPGDPISISLPRSRIVPTVALLVLLLVTYQTVFQHTIFPQSTVFASAPRQRVLIVHNATDKYGEMAYANAVRALDYARLNHDDLDLAAGHPWPELGQYSTLLFATEFLDQIGQAEVGRILDYVNDGGGLAVVFRGWNPQLAPLFGIDAGAEYPDLIEDEGGLSFAYDFFPGVKGLTLSEKSVQALSFFDVELLPEAQLIASSGAGKPIAWLHHHGRGRVIFWNTSLLAEKNARGFIVQSVLNVQGLGVLPIANFATMHVDDFPAAISTDKLEPLKTEYDMNMVAFFDQVWFPDMMEIARQYGLVYTWLIPFNYNGVIEPPFDFREWKHAKIDIDGQSVLYSVYASHLAAQGHELGFHGYNHVSLTAENWPSEERMVTALQAAAKRWEADNLGPQPTTYVPPNNLYDATGARALTQAFPSLKVLAGIYTGPFERGGNREFSPEPWNPQLFNIPRVTSGYRMTPRYRFAMISELGMMGIWTHFIHPDDVIHTPENYPHDAYHRNPKSWPWHGDHTGEKNGFYYRFLRWLDFAQATYPWLRYVRTDEAHYLLRAHLKNQVVVELKPHETAVRTAPGSYFQVRISDGRRLNLNRLQGAQFVHLHQGEGYTLYTLRALKGEVSLKLLIPESFADERPTRPAPQPQFASDTMEEKELEPPDLQRLDASRKPLPTPTPLSEPQPAPTATPALDVLPMSTPTLRSRP